MVANICSITYVPSSILVLSISYTNPPGIILVVTELVTLVAVFIFWFQSGKFEAWRPLKATKSQEIRTKNRGKFDDDSKQLTTASRKHGNRENRQEEASRTSSISVNSVYDTV
jgi:hypothetical protein